MFTGCSSPTEASLNIKNESKTSATLPSKPPESEQLEAGSTALNIIDDGLPLSDSEPRPYPITHIVVHFSSQVAENPKDPFNLTGVYNMYVKEGVSTHYLIDRKGTIYRLVPENRVAYHAGKGSLPDFPVYTNVLNRYSIGIECLAIGSKEDMAPFLKPGVYDTLNPDFIGFTDAQYQSLNKLIRDIINRNPGILRDRKHVIGHEEYSPGRRTDPGTLFDWSRINLGNEKAPK